MMREGNRIPDEQRASTLGTYCGGRRLDELPQLYNILIGEMSFVGPRPLLAVDQPEEMHRALLVRPGLTGFAQVHGGRNISAEDKNALDLWYVRNASLWLDIEILLRTSMVLIRGERVNHAILRAARDERCLRRPRQLQTRVPTRSHRRVLGRRTSLSHPSRRLKCTASAGS